MVKHYIIWKLKENVLNKDKVVLDIKTNLENLVGRINGLVSMKISTEKLDSSSGDVMMDSTFESIASLKEYSKNPLHQNVANTFVRPFVEVRLSFDTEI